MSESLGEAVLELSTDNSGLNRGLSQGEKRSGQTIKRMKGAMLGMGRAMSIGFTVPMVLAAKSAAGELNDIDAANAQTAAGLKSTGGAAHVSSAQIHKLATSLQNLSGMDDQAIQSGENMLLTFTNIQNRAGKNNDIFNQSSEAMVNFATKMKIGPEQAALMLGKALNDPAKGLTKLQKAGVTFTEQQKKQVEAMQKAGDVAGAQKVILHELNKEFGGAAQAAGKTDAARWAVMIDNLKGIGAELLRSVLPAFRTFVGWLTQAMGKFEALSPGVKHFIGTLMLIAVAIGPVSSAIGAVLTVISAVGAVVAAVGLPFAALAFVLGVLAVQWLKTGNHMQVFKAKVQQVAMWVKNVAWPAIIEGAKKAMRWYQSNIAPVISSVLANVKATLSQWIAWGKAAWEKWGADISRVVKTYFGIMKTIVATDVKIIGSIINAILAVLRGDWGGAWKSLKAAVSASLHGCIAVVKQLGPYLAAAGKLLWSVFKTATVAYLKTVGHFWAGAVRLAAQGVWDLGSWLLSQSVTLAKNIITGIIQGIESGASAVASAVGNIAQAALDAAKRKLHIKSPSRVFRDEVGRPIMDGIALGLTLGLPGVLNTMQRNMKTLTDASAESVKNANTKLDQAKGILTHTKSLVADFKRVNALEKSQSIRLSDAQQRVKDANHALNAANKKKDKGDIEHAKNTLRDAKAALITAKAALPLARKQLKNDADLAGVSLKNLKTLTQVNKAILKQTAAVKAAAAVAAKAEADAAAAEQAAQAELDAAQAKQDALDAGLNAIRDNAALALNSDALNEALNGGPTIDGLRQKITDLKAEYDALQTYLTQNAANLSASAQADIIGTMADVIGQINDTTSQVNDILNPTGDGADTSTSGGAAAGADGGDTTSRVTVVQQFTSEPDMFAASRSALFAYQTAGLVAG